MTLRSKLGGIANRLLTPLDVAVVRKTELEGYRGRFRTSRTADTSQNLPEGAAARLRRDHPRLQELEQRYRRVTHDGTRHAQWGDSFTMDVQMPFIRGDNAYVFQERDGNDASSHVLTYYYLKTLDTLDLLDRLTEDGAFGARTYPCAGRLVSRDLLDSVSEILFLERALGLSERDRFTVLDIGAGYGRLAHRLSEAFEARANVLCTDAIAGSTFVSEYYLSYREATSAEVVPLDEIEARLEGETVDIAVNVHSFSECPRRAIQWWLALIERVGASHVFIVPNRPHERDRAELLSSEGGGRTEAFLDDVIRAGYRLARRSPKYDDTAVQSLGVSPTDYFLFSRA